jgi:hypothetical protein
MLDSDLGVALNKFMHAYSRFSPALAFSAQSLEQIGSARLINRRPQTMQR